jgi:hypothetical protein
MTRGICPVCNGTGHKPCPDHLRKYGVSSGWYGYRAEDDTVSCDNCGAQYMMGRPSGEVALNKEGVPCTHSYNFSIVGRGLTQYVCVHCGDSYQIDSGD